MGRDGYHGGDERGAWDRTRDEVSSWFGDDEAARRREMDSRRSEGWEHDEDRGWRGRDERDERWRSGESEDGGSGGFAGGGSEWNEVGYDGDFGGGTRFDRIDPGSTGTHGVHPVASPFGAGYGGYAAGGGYSSSARARALLQRSRQGSQSGSSGGGSQGQAMGRGWSQSGESNRHDPHYSEYRQRQLERLDREYEDYCRERQSRFDQDFETWRTSRGGSEPRD